MCFEWNLGPEDNFGAKFAMNFFCIKIFFFYAKKTKINFVHCCRVR